MDRASCVFECVFSLTDIQAHYNDSAATVGFGNLTKRWVILKVWSEWGPDMRTTAQNKSSLVWVQEWARGAVPSHLLLKSGQDRSAPRAFLSQCALVKGPDNRKTDAASRWRQTQISQQTSLTVAHGQAGNRPPPKKKKRWVSTERLGHRREAELFHLTQPPISMMSRTCCSPRSSMYFNDKQPQTPRCWCLLERWVT